VTFVLKSDSSVAVYEKNAICSFLRITEARHTLNNLYVGLFVCSVFNDAFFRNSDYIASNERMINESWIGKDVR
jgi:hypothetical protein